jgi:phosphoglycerate-specific signal transduction histidine kinase
MITQLEEVINSTQPLAKSIRVKRHVARLSERLVTVEDELLKAVRESNLALAKLNNARQEVEMVQDSLDYYKNNPDADSL